MDKDLNRKKLKVEVVTDLKEIPDEWKEFFDEYGINASDSTIKEEDKKLVIKIDDAINGIHRDPETGELVVAGKLKVKTSKGKEVLVKAKTHLKKEDKQNDEMEL